MLILIIQGDKKTCIVLENWQFEHDFLLKFQSVIKIFSNIFFFEILIFIKLSSYKKKLLN